MGAIFRLNPTSDWHLGAPQENRKQQEDAPLRVHRLNCLSLPYKISEVLLKEKLQQRSALINYVNSKSNEKGSKKIADLPYRSIRIHTEAAVSFLSGLQNTGPRFRILRKCAAANFLC